jgi:P27 family predicted phage terminase small subunit
MSPPRKPTKLKLIQGTARKCRLNPDEPTPDVEIPGIPHHLSKEARAEWRRITPILEEHGIISQLDMVALAMYCQSWGDHVQAENMIRRNGKMLKNEKTGIMYPSPWLKVSRESKEIARKLLKDFGLTPADLSRVSGKKKEPKGKARLDFL